MRVNAGVPVASVRTDWGTPPSRVAARLTASATAGMANALK